MIFAHERKECVFKKAAAGECRKSARLGHGKQVFIFVEDGISKRSIRLIPGRAAPQKRLPIFQNEAGRDSPVINIYLAGLKTALPVGPRGMAIFEGQVGQNSKASASIIYLLPILESIIWSQFFCLFNESWRYGFEVFCLPWVFLPRHGPWGKL